MHSWFNSKIDMNNCIANSFEKRTILLFCMLMSLSCLQILISSSSKRLGSLEMVFQNIYSFTVFKQQRDVYNDIVLS